MARGTKRARTGGMDPSGATPDIFDFVAMVMAYGFLLFVVLAGLRAIALGIWAVLFLAYDWPARRRAARSAALPA